MPRRRQFTGIAYGVLTSFVSRNNDVGGYWAIGKLCRHAIKTGAMRVEIDLLTRIVSPAGEQFEELAETWARRLQHHCAAQHVPIDWLFGANISIEFMPKYGSREHPYVCRVTLIDDIRNPRTASTVGFCWPHNPAREWKSASRDQTGPSA